jgi:streptogramin lyase
VPSAAYWRFEEGAPPAADSSGNGNTGSVTGATYSTLVPWVPFANTRSLLFDDKADQVEIPAGPGTNLDTFANGITVEAIIRPEELPIPPDGAGQRISYVLWADDGTYELVLISDASGATTLRGGVNAVGGASGPCTTSVSSAFVQPFTFIHVAMTYAAEVLELHIDGKLVDVANAPGGCGSSVGPVGFRDIVRIGNDETAVGFPSNDRAFRGWIDEVRITGQALDPADFLRAGADELFVGVWSSNLLQRFDVASGTLLETLPAPSSPRGMVIGPDGDLFIAYQDSNDVKRHNRLTGASLGVFASGPELEIPIDLAFGPDGHLYVSSQLPQRILRYDGATGAFIDVFADGPELVATSALRFGPDGNLYVSQSTLFEVRRFDGNTGAFIDTFTSGSTGDLMNGFVFGPDGNLYAVMSRVDLFTNIGRVSRFDGQTGAYIDDFVSEGSGGLESGHALAFGPEGHLYVADFFGRRVLRYDGQTGAFIDVFSVNGGQIDPLHFVPEPAEWMMWLAGVTFLATVGRRRMRCSPVRDLTI